MVTVDQPLGLLGTRSAADALFISHKLPRTLGQTMRSLVVEFTEIRELGVPWCRVLSVPKKFTWSDCTMPKASGVFSV